jgi:hypothetical protein
MGHRGETLDLYDDAAYPLFLIFSDRIPRR